MQHIKGTITRKVKTLPAEVGEETIKYSSSNQKIATVSKKGKVTARAAGIAIIKVACNGKKDTYKVKVKPAKVSGFSVKSTTRRKAVMTWKRVTGATGYEIQCSINSKNLAKVNPIRIKKVRNVRSTINKLTGGKTIYVRIRTYWKKSKVIVYGDYTGKRTCKVKR